MKTLRSNQFLLIYGMLGFTLVELMIALTLTAIVLVLAIPSFKNIIMNSRISAETNAIASSLNYARNIAVSQNATTTVCPFSAQGSTTCGGNWQSGWIVVNQSAINGPTLLQTNMSGSNDPVLSSTAASVTFDTVGIATTQAHFKTCDSRGGAYAESVEVLPTGFVETGYTMGTAVWDGTALTCP